MAYVGGVLRIWERTPALVRLRLVELGFLGLLGLVVLNVASGGPEWLVAWHITTVFLLFTGSLIVGRYLSASASDSSSRSFLTSFQILLLLGLIAITYQSRNPGFGIGIHRGLETWAVFFVVMTFCILAGDPRRYTPVQWLAIGCFSTVIGIFFHHSISVAEVSVRSRHPVWAGIIMGISLVVLPQYISLEQFLWALNRLAAILVLLALPVYLIGEYSLYGIQFGFQKPLTIPLVEYHREGARSLFRTSNAFATVALAGLVGALGELQRAYERELSLLSIGAIGALLVINFVGLAISFGRTLWVITPVVAILYVAYLTLGRRSIPIAILVCFVYIISGIYAVHTGIISLPEGTPTRSNAWYPSIKAIIDNPSLLGEGLINPSRFTEKYAKGRTASSTHNSYFSIWIRAGIVGGIAYVSLIGSSLIQGALRYRDVNIAILGLAIVFAIHQLFEAYTMFGWGVSSVLATLSIGFLIRSCEGDCW